MGGSRRTHVVASPRRGPIAGLPHDAGFHPGRCHGRVEGVPDVWAAGETRRSPSSRAASQPSRPTPSPRRPGRLGCRPSRAVVPVLHGRLLAGGAPPLPGQAACEEARWLRSRAAPLWSPPRRSPGATWRRTSTTPAGAPRSPGCARRPMRAERCRQARARACRRRRGAAAMRPGRCRRGGGCARALPRRASLTRNARGRRSRRRERTRGRPMSGVREASYGQRRRGDEPQRLLPRKPARHRAARRTPHGCSSRASTLTRSRSRWWRWRFSTTAPSRRRRAAVWRRWGSTARLASGMGLARVRAGRPVAGGACTSGRGRRRGGRRVRDRDAALRRGRARWRRAVRRGSAAGRRCGRSPRRLAGLPTPRRRLAEPSPTPTA